MNLFLLYLYQHHLLNIHYLNFFIYFFFDGFLFIPGRDTQLFKINNIIILKSLNLF